MGRKQQAAVPVEGSKALAEKPYWKDRSDVNGSDLNSLYAAILQLSHIISLSPSIHLNL